MGQTIVKRIIEDYSGRFIISKKSYTIHYLLLKQQHNNGYLVLQQDIDVDIMHQHQYPVGEGGGVINMTLVVVLPLIM